MKVWVKVGKRIIETEGIPCGQGDAIEIREGPAKGIHVGRSKKWGRLDGRYSTHTHKKDKQKQDSD